MLLKFLIRPFYNTVQKESASKIEKLRAVKKNRMSLAHLVSEFLVEHLPAKDNKKNQRSRRQNLFVPLLN